MMASEQGFEWYTPDRIFSYDRILNFVIGARGIGKSYGTKKNLVNRFKKLGKQFIYVRRYKSELKKVKNFFNDIKPEFPDDKLVVKGNELYVNGEVAGWAIALSAWQNEKSNAYPKVETIFFDEFIREKGGSVGYLPNETEALLNLMDTVFRKREDVRTICLSNAVTIANPYFLYFNLIPNIEKRFNAWKDVVIEIPDSSDFASVRRQTKFGSLIDGTNYADMSLDNKFTHDVPTFLAKRSGKAKHKFAIAFNGHVYGFWLDKYTGFLYMSKDSDPDCPHVFALTQDDMQEGRQFRKTLKSDLHLRQVRDFFDSGYLLFDKQVTRHMGYEIIKRFG